MKKRLSFSAVLFFLICSLTIAQSDLKLAKVAEENNSNGKGYRVDAHQYLEKFNKANGIEIEKISQSATALQKSAAWNFNVNDKGPYQNGWYASDFVTNAFYSVPSTCRAVGTNCYIFVEDALWETKVNQVAVDSVREAFDNRTPANPNKGIYQTDVDVFGNPPNVDGDSKIIILILDIKDGYSGGGYVGGYYYGYNQFQQANSNFAEIYYLDGVQNNLLTEGGLQEGMSTTAHEFQHMIHFNYIQGDITFFDESWALGAEIINGYPVYAPSLYANDYNVDCFSWRETEDPNVLNDYSRGSWFALYLKEQLGTNIFKKYLELGKSQSLKGGAALDGALTSLNAGRTVNQILEDWFIANYLNDKSVDARWGYDYYGLPSMASQKFYTPNASGSGSVYSRAVQYLSFLNGSDLKALFTTNVLVGVGLKVKAIKIGVAGKTVTDVSFGTEFMAPEFGTDYNEVTFLVYQNNRSWVTAGPHAYNYSVTGSSENQVIELAYDQKEPSGVYDWPVGDSVAVVFDGVSGYKLDSIRVALRTLKAMNGGVWQAAASSSKLFGKALAVPITVTGKTYVSGNYPSHWTNWVTLDLRSYNIKADNSFVASFVVDGAYQQNSANGPNRVMHTYQPSSNSLTFTTQNNTRKWYNLYVDNVEPKDSFIVYLIRAYVSTGTSDVEEVVELIPSAYSLDQNYPNPFNPSTIISYSIPTPGNVQIKIYDVLGREVRSLINEEKAAGKYNIAWDSRDNYGRRVSSGIYFYTITAGSFIQTRKMVLTK